MGVSNKSDLMFLAQVCSPGHRGEIAKRCALKINVRLIAQQVRLSRPWMNQPGSRPRVDQVRHERPRKEISDGHGKERGKNDQRYSFARWPAVKTERVDRKEQDRTGQIACS